MPGAALEVRGTVEAEVSGGDGALGLGEHRLDLGAGPDVIPAFLALGIGVA